MTDYSTFGNDKLDFEIAQRRGVKSVRLTIEAPTMMELNDDGVLRGRWSTDLNEAVELLKEMPYHGLYYSGTEWELAQPDRESEFGISAITGDDAARLISEQYCIYTNAHPTPAMLNDITRATRTGGQVDGDYWEREGEQHVD